MLVCQQQNGRLLYFAYATDHGSPYWTTYLGSATMFSEGESGDREIVAAIKLIDSVQYLREGHVGDIVYAADVILRPSVKTEFVFRVADADE